MVPVGSDKSYGLREQMVTTDEKPSSFVALPFLHLLQIISFKDRETSDSRYRKHIWKQGQSSCYSLGGIEKGHMTIRS